MISSPLAAPRSISRPSSRGSFSGRAPSPSISVAEDPVALRQQMSNLRHSIRHQTAQLQNLESLVLRGPRPLPPGTMSSPTHSPTELPDTPNSANSSNSTTTNNITPPRLLSKRSSREILHGLAGPDSSLPLPKRDAPRTRTTSQDGMDGIREGIPSNFASSSNSTPRRPSSPTRSLSRIPVASVGNARTLTDEGPPPGLYINDSQSNLGITNTPTASPSSRRASFTPSGTTKVLAELQAGILSTRNKLDDTKHQLRQSQRQVSQLTRQTEDLKEVRERLRLENEGLNNVVARKERLLQELLERARKAESEVIALRAQLKAESTTSKKNVRDMESTVTEATARSQKSEREYFTLKDSLEKMKKSWKADTDSLRAEISTREEKWRVEAKETAKKYRLIADELISKETDRESIKAMRAEDERIRKNLEDGFRKQIDQLRTEMERQSKDNVEAVDTARRLSVELTRLRRLMRNVGSGVDDAHPDGVPS